jgi:serine/threonine protein kinase
MGLSRIHEQGYVHRDVSAKNIFIKKINDGFTIPQIGDFGLVRHSDMKTTQRTMNDTFSICYAAPEQMKEVPDKPTPLFDSWAAAVILYEMLAG